MSNIQRVGTRNKIKTPARRYQLSDVISESYNLLYECDKDSRAYRLVESHINNIRENPESLDSLSRDLCILKGVVALGESAIIKESDISGTQEFSNDMKLNQKNLDKDRDVEQMDDPDVINEEEEVPGEEDLEEPGIPEEEESIYEEEENVEDEITKEELTELKKHLKEMRRARKVRESKKTSKKSVKESRSWMTEKDTMSAALKHFRESSVNKAFYNTFNKMSPRLKDSEPLSLQESLLLYKASNSAMTQLAIELERNPEFIYTFRECTSILSEDTKSLLECIRQHKSPSKSLVESIRTFANILLESEEEPEDFEDYEEEDIVTEEEEIPDEEIPAESEEEVIEEEDEEEEIPVEEESPELEEEEIISPEDEEEEVIEEEEEENPDDLVFEESEDNEEITDEEAEALRKKLEEIRSRK